MVFRQSLCVLSSVVVLALAACSSSSTTSATANKPDVSTTPAATTEKDADHAHSGSEKDHDHDHASGDHSGQVIEAGKYHLELVTAKEADGTHLDFKLQQGDSHEAIPNAKVTAQVQLPDGTQKTLNLKYEADAKLYEAELRSKLPGDYKVVILSDINGEKVNGRFAFKQ